MATYAAMVERLDRGVGRILAELKSKGLEHNTLVMFLSDNGACAEDIQPGWYDVPSRTRDGQTVKVGNNNPEVRAGPNEVWQSYGLPWANVGNTPFLLYKHFTHEGGIATPFIARWPAGITTSNAVSGQLGHVTDLMATVVELAGAKHPDSFEGHAIQPLEGRSLLPIFQGKVREQTVPIFWEHEGNRAVRWQQWKLVARAGRDWELFDVAADRTEQRNVAADQAEKVKELAALYQAWAARCNVVPPGQLPRERAIPPGKAVGTD